MARRKAQKNYYVATDINGQMFSIDLTGQL